MEKGVAKVLTTVVNSTNTERVYVSTETYMYNRVGGSITPRVGGGKMYDKCTCNSYVGFKCGNSIQAYDQKAIDSNTMT